MSRITITANSLWRNDRVVVDDGLPYLVDEVSDAPDGGVDVKFSSGDTSHYAAEDKVRIVD
ncbi:hypothetical protein ACWHAG_20890 [Streptomyces albidoflavus]